ncbi:MAG: SurA N-terminal domain-containing protein [Odoribacter sp.]|nr:SurA N-terminal domain-containing protein [Odoribacter sp.]
MATLEKIRSKSVLLFVIIIVALLAFILGDFLTSGRTYFGTGTTVAKAGSVKVDYNDYQERMNLMSEQARNQQVDNGMLAQQAINDLLVEKLLQKEYEDLGIVVTDHEITEALTGANIHPAAMQSIYMLGQYLGMPGADPRSIHAAIMNPPANIPAEAAQQLQLAWAQMEQQVEQLMLREKFDRLVLGLFTANELDAQSLYNDVTTTRHFTYASKPFSSIDDKDVELTDADRKAAWEENKSRYMINEPIRSVDYIMVRIEPSADDRAAGVKAVEEALLGLKSTEGTDAVINDSRFVVNRATATASQLRDNDLKAFLDSASVGDAVQLKNIGDNFTLVKLLGVSTDVDSINISMLGRADGGSLDSLKTLVDGGATFASLSDNETIQGQDSIWASLVAPNIPANIKEALTTHAVGETFVVTDSAQGQVFETLYRINRRNAPVKVYDVAEIAYTIDPSAETLSKLSSDLHTFVSNNSSAADFAANAAEAGYTVLNGIVSASSPMLGNVPDSRQAVKWLMEAKPGKVMPVYQDSKQTYLLAAALKNVYDDDFLPWNADIIADDIDAIALNNKKAQTLIEKYAGKANDVAGYAKLMEVSPQNSDAMFTAPMLATIGMGESALQGIVDAAPEGKVVGPVKGNNEVIVFVVTGSDNTGRQYTFEEYAEQFKRTLNMGNARTLQNPTFLQTLLLGNDRVQNNSLKFIQGIGE